MTAVHSPEVPNAADLTCRLLGGADVPAVLRLWEASGWGTITPEQWRRWYVDTPWGESIVAGLVDAAGGVLAQIVLTPVALELAGGRRRAMRVSAPILAHALRTPAVRRPEHPIPRLLSLAAAAARRQDVAALYALPEAGWLPVFAAMRRHDDPLLWFQTATFPCRQAQLAGVASDAYDRWGVLADGLSVENVEEFGAEYDVLWSDVRDGAGVACALVRDARALRYRHGAHRCLAVRSAPGGPLAGYVAVKRRSGLVVDALAREPALLPAVLGAAVHTLATEPGGEFPVLKAMATPALLPALDALGFAPVPEFTFAFACNAIGAGVPAAAVAPDRWFLMAGD